MTMAQYGFHINTDICMGCKACMTSCFDRNDLEVPQKFRRVYEYGGGDWTAGSQGDFMQSAFAYYVSLTCCQCDVPACVTECPTGAMQKDPETGIVNNDKETCIGCMTCREVCPYHHTFWMDGVSHKCILCSDETLDGSPAPACTAACPVRALEFGLIDDLRAKYGDNDVIADLGNTTAPNVVIGLHRDADRGGELMNPLEIDNQ